MAWGKKKPHPDLRWSLGFIDSVDFFDKSWKENWLGSEIWWLVYVFYHLCSSHCVSSKQEYVCVCVHKVRVPATNIEWEVYSTRVNTAQSGWRNVRGCCGGIVQSGETWVILFTLINGTKGFSLNMDEVLCDSHSAKMEDKVIVWRDDLACPVCILPFFPGRVDSECSPCLSWCLTDD